MRMLQRYIFGDLLRIFAALLSVLTVLLVFVGVFQQVSESGLGPEQVLKILPFVVPSMLPFTIPATLLLTVCLVYGKMAGHREITAAKAAGVNVMSLLWPSLMLAIVMSVCSFVLTDRIIPWAMGNIQNIVAQAMEDIFLDVLRTRHQITDPHKGYRITVMRVDGKTLITPTFQYQRLGGKPAVMQADTATLDFDLENQRVVLHLVNGHVDLPNGQRIFFKSEDRAFPLPREMSDPKERNLPIHALTHRIGDFERRVTAERDRQEAAAALAYVAGDFEMLSQPQFKNRAGRLQNQMSSIRRHRTEIHGRYALAASCFFFVFLGAPVAILQGRSQFLTTFFACFLPILLGYYPIVLGMMSLSKSGAVDPAWAMWLGNVGLFLIGAYFLRKVLRY